MEKIIFYYDKKSLYIKAIMLFLASIICIAIIFIIDLCGIDITNKIAGYIVKALIIMAFWSFLSISTVSRWISLKRFFEITSDKITYFYNFLDSGLIAELDFYWEDINAIEKEDNFLSYKIIIIYKDYFNNKIKKKKIKIHDSQIPYDEIYDILVDKWNEYKNNTIKQL